jgi:hypothetical protein
MYVRSLHIFISCCNTPNNNNNRLGGVTVGNQSLGFFVLGNACYAKM